MLLHCHCHTIIARFEVQIIYAPPCPEHPQQILRHSSQLTTTSVIHRYIMGGHWMKFALLSSDLDKNIIVRLIHTFPLSHAEQCIPVCICDQS